MEDEKVVSLNHSIELMQQDMSMEFSHEYKRSRAQHQKSEQMYLVSVILFFASILTLFGSLGVEAYINVLGIIDIPLIAFVAPMIIASVFLFFRFNRKIAWVFFFVGVVLTSFLQIISIFGFIGQPYIVKIFIIVSAVSFIASTFFLLKTIIH